MLPRSCFCLFSLSCDFPGTDLLFPVNNADVNKIQLSTALEIQRGAHVCFGGRYHYLEGNVTFRGVYPNICIFVKCILRGFCNVCNWKLDRKEVALDYRGITGDWKINCPKYAEGLLQVILAPYMKIK